MAAPKQTTAPWPPPPVTPGEQDKTKDLFEVTLDNLLASLSPEDRFLYDIAREWFNYGYAPNGPIAAENPAMAAGMARYNALKQSLTPDQIAKVNSFISGDNPAWLMFLEGATGNRFYFTPREKIPPGISPSTFFPGSNAFARPEASFMNPDAGSSKTSSPVKRDAGQSEPVNRNSSPPPQNNSRPATFKTLVNAEMRDYVQSYVSNDNPVRKSALLKVFSGQPLTPEESSWMSRSATSDYDVAHTMQYYKELLNVNADQARSYASQNPQDPVLPPDVSSFQSYALQFAPAAAPAAAPVAAAPVAAAPVAAAPVAAAPVAAAPVAASPVAAAPAAAAHPAPWDVKNVTAADVQSRARQSFLDAQIVEMFASARPEELALFTAAAKFINTGETPEDPIESQNMFNYIQSDDPLWTSYVEKNYGDPLRFYNETASAENAARQMQYSDDVVAFDREFAGSERQEQQDSANQKRRQTIQDNLQGKIDFGVQQGSGEEFYFPSGTEAQDAARSAVRRASVQSNSENNVAKVEGENAESQRFYPEIQNEVSRQLASLASFFPAEYSMVQNPPGPPKFRAPTVEQQYMYPVSLPSGVPWREQQSFVSSEKMYPVDTGAESPRAAEDMYGVSSPSVYGPPQTTVSQEKMYSIDTGSEFLPYVSSEDVYGASRPSVYGPPQNTVSQEKMYFPENTDNSALPLSERLRMLSNTVSSGEAQYGYSSGWGVPQSRLSSEKMYPIDTGSEFLPYASSEDVYGASRPSVYGPPQNTVSQEKMYFPESTGNSVLPLSERLRMLSNTVSSGEAQYGYSSGWGVPQSRLSSEETYFAANRSALPSWNDTVNAPQDTMYKIPFEQEKKPKPAYEKKPELGQPGEYGSYMREMDRNTRPGGPSFGWKDDPEYADAINNDRTFTQPGPNETMRLREDVPDYRGRATNSSMQRYRGAASDPAYAEEINRDSVPVVPVPEEPYRVEQNKSGATRWGGAAQLLRNTQPAARRPTKWGGY